MKQSLNDAIMIIRRQKKLSQLEVDRRLGFWEGSMSAIESGRRKITAQELFLLSQLFDVTTESIYALADRIEKLYESVKDIPQGRDVTFWEALSEGI
jgi:transcriptional regulator with XRE-family HTH domain